MSDQLPKSFGQVPLPIPGERERDRNFAVGGRSFYFFDFDDNIVHLQTKIVLFHKSTGEEKEVPTGEYPEVHRKLGVKGGDWEHFEIRGGGDYADFSSSYRNFREQPAHRLEGRPQPLIQDMHRALQNPFLEWRGPSWSFFAHAVDNNRPISIITARGHHPHTIRRAVDLLVLSRDLQAHPNYLSLYPVSHPETRKILGDQDFQLDVGALKKLAIIAAVNDAFACYGENPGHRFGMSDDDPHNVDLIREAMLELKEKHPANAFFVFNTYGGKLVREEVLVGGETRASSAESEGAMEQLSLF